jgi:uncharacterized membrane protein
MTNDAITPAERAEERLLQLAARGAIRGRARAEDDRLWRAAMTRASPDEFWKWQLEDEWWEQHAKWSEAAYAPKKYADVVSEFGAGVDVNASAARCFRLWRDPDALRRFVPGLAAIRPAPDGRCFECTQLYQFADPRTHDLEELRFMTHIAEETENRSIHYQATDGFPNGVVVTFDASEEDASWTSVNVEYYCHLPMDLAVKEGVMRVSLDVEGLVTECLTRFAKLAAGADGEDDGDDDDTVFPARALPVGAGLRGKDGREVERGAPTVASKRAMREAREAFVKRVGREPFNTELLKGETQTRGAR